MCQRHSAPDHLRIGVLTTTPHDSDKATTQDLVCCIHCGYVWTWQPGSGRQRGWCMKCNGLLCGRRVCRARPCQHWLHGIDNLEAGQPEETPKKIIVPTSF